MTAKETKELKQARDLACEYIGRCESASLEIDSILSQLLKCEEKKLSDLTLDNLLDIADAVNRLRDLCCELDVPSNDLWYRKEHK